MSNFGCPAAEPGDLLCWFSNLPSGTDEALISINAHVWCPLAIKKQTREETLLKEKQKEPINWAQVCGLREKLSTDQTSGSLPLWIDSVGVEPMIARDRAKEFKYTHHFVEIFFAEDMHARRVYL